MAEQIADQIPTRAQFLECIVMARAELLKQLNVTPNMTEEAQASALWKFTMKHRAEQKGRISSNVADALEQFRGRTCEDCPLPELHIALEMDKGNG